MLRNDTYHNRWENIGEKRLRQFPLLIPTYITDYSWSSCWSFCYDYFLFFFPTFYSPGSLLHNHQNYIVTVSKKPSLTFSFLRVDWMIPIFVLTNPWAYLCHLPALYWHHLLRISYSSSVDCMIIVGRRYYTSFPPG